MMPSTGTRARRVKKLARASAWVATSALLVLCLEAAQREWLWRWIWVALACMVALNAIGVNKIEGFFTNDTHNQWTINEIRWATQVAKRTHGAHFIVNTSSNGQGPKLNPHPTTQGVEDLCNLLEAAGYPVRRAEDVPGTPQFFVHDPFGNRIELVPA